MRGSAIGRRRMSSKVSATLPDLPYDYNALEPVISAQIMQLHHKKHHNAYVTNLNKTLDLVTTAEAKNDLSTILQLRPALNFNGGGHINHSIFWTNLTSPDSQSAADHAPSLSAAIASKFGSVDAFITQMTAKAASVQGSGWAWLGYDAKTRSLEVVAMPNQDALQPVTGLVPILGIDCWEHAFYLQYLNDRPKYLGEIWRCVSWSNLEQRYASAAATSP